MPQKRAKVVVVGAGNLAWHLVPKLSEAGYQVDLWSRQSPQQLALAGWDAQRIHTIPATVLKTDLPEMVFLAVPDGAIASMSKELSTILPNFIPVVHTSGATPLDHIDAYFQQRGVLWPIFSLKLGQAIQSWSQVPLAYYANNHGLIDRLHRCTSRISQQTFLLDDQQRAQLHLAAVFGNNFTNWLCQIAYELCTEKEIPFSAILPLIRQTFEQLDGNAPAQKQTGAALRGDHTTMLRHLELLREQPQYARLYDIFSQLIIQSTTAQ